MGLLVPMGIQFGCQDRVSPLKIWPFVVFTSDQSAASTGDCTPMDKPIAAVVPVVGG
jgi:hypothetical protein